MSRLLLRCSSLLRGQLSSQLTTAHSCQAAARMSSSAWLQNESRDRTKGGRGQPGPGGRQRKKPGGRQRKRDPGWAPYEAADVNPDSEWSSVYTRPRPFDPYLIPLPIRMGWAGKDDIAPPAVGNLELMKIPNFFHLTPLHIKKHCEALKPLCTPWPSRLPYLPLRIETRNYIFPGQSIKHLGASKVVLTFKLSDLMLTKRARKKMIELAGSRYEYSSRTGGIIRLVGKRCPTRKQNLDYVMYLLKVLYLESNRVEPWEEEEASQFTG